MKKLAFGLMRLPLCNEKDNTSINYDVVKEMVDEFLKKGFSHFDTAYVYHGGLSEVAFRECVVKRYPRESFTITDKMPLFSMKDASELEKIFNEQLERCGVTYFDYYWLHAVNLKSYNEKIKPFKAFEFIQSKKEAGQIKHIGFSFHDSAEALDTILSEHPEVEYVQLQINYLDWDDENVQSRKCYEIAVKHGKKVMVMEPIKGGSLAAIPDEAERLLKEANPNVSIASWAIRYAASLENVEYVLSGMSEKTQMDDNLSYMENFIPLTVEENKMMEKVASIIKETITIPCTACHYCTDGCPMKIAIPEYFDIYNTYKRFKGSQKGRAVNGLNRYHEEGRGLPSSCIGCLQCESHCPQHIEITSWLKEIANELE